MLIVALSKEQAYVHGCSKVLGKFYSQVRSHLRIQLSSCCSNEVRFDVLFGPIFQFVVLLESVYDFVKFRNKLMASNRISDFIVTSGYFPVIGFHFVCECKEMGC